MHKFFMVPKKRAKKPVPLALSSAEASSTLKVLMVLVRRASKPKPSKPMEHSKWINYSKPLRRRALWDGNVAVVKDRTVESGGITIFFNRAEVTAFDSTWSNFLCLDEKTSRR